MARMIRSLALALAGSFWLSAAQAAGCDRADAVQRTAVLAAYQPEWTALLGEIAEPEHHVIGRVDFVTGRIGDEPVVAFLSGVSMINAAMASQRVIDCFAVKRIVVSGIAGGVDPAFAIGDVVVPEEWREYLEAAFARETPDGYKIPDFFGPPQTANFGIIFPVPVELPTAGGQPEYKQWFAVDRELLAVARKAAASVTLDRCASGNSCLTHKPRIEIGGRGVSGPVFVDNAKFREHVSKAFQARALDMESAAVAHVAYANDVPFIAFRSLSDLAGGDEDSNQMKTFEDLAARNSVAVLVAFLRALR